MGSKYTSQSVSGYNSSPPADDGSQAASNLITWAGIKTKLADTIKTAVESINTALVTAFDYSVRSITASDNTVAGDHMRIVEIASTVTTAVTVSLMDATSATTNYRTWVKNSSTRYQTIGRVTSGDTIDGVAGNVLVGPGDCIGFEVNASANGYVTIGGRSSMALIQTASASNSATIDFTLPSGYDVLLLTMTDVIPATDGANLLGRVSISASYKSGASDYGYSQGGGTSAPAAYNNGSTGTTSLLIAAQLSNANSARNFGGQVLIFNPAGTSVSKQIQWSGGYLSSAPAYVYVNGTGEYVGGTSGSATAALDGFRLLMSAGNITSGNFALYGLRKS